MRIYSYILILFMGMLFSCNSDEESGLPSAEDRKDEAINDLVDELVDAVNGWKLEYRPNADNGAYLILLNFDDNGTVTIHSDVAGDDGDNFFEQQIRYRIDATLGLELIFETYGVFHYLFEQQDATFGGEFVFTFLEEESGHLLFESKSDLTDKTILEFVPAQSNDINLISTGLSENLRQYAGLVPQVFPGEAPIQHLAFTDKGISVFWSIDLLTRIINVDMAALGVTLDEVLLNDTYIKIDHLTGFTIQNEAIILDTPFSFTLNGEQSTIGEVSFTNYELEKLAFCSADSVEYPQYMGEVASLGTVKVRKSLTKSAGFDFTPMSDTPYSVNPFFIADENSFSLLLSGSIGEKFPNASLFVFNHGLDDAEEPSDAIGFVIASDSGPSKTYLRELSSIIREGNKLILDMSDTYYYSETPDANDQQHLMEITDEIFEGGVVYIFDLPQDNAKVFWLYNPCNEYEVFLVQ